VKFNLVMELPKGLELGNEVDSPFEPPPVDKELGVGEYYAWQVPVYRELLAEALAVSN